MHEKASATAMYGGSFVAMLSLNDVGILIGIMVGIGGFLYNIIYQERKAKRDIEYKEKLLQIAREKGLNASQETEK